MKISRFNIKNFRKLKNCSIELSNDQTIFVGANNSGKTSAMDALLVFLKKDRRKKITTNDFTLSNWIKINNIGKDWINCSDPRDLDLSDNHWLELLPTVDVWLDVDESEIHYVSNLIPRLTWEGRLLCIRLRFEPKDIEKLYKEFKDSFENAKNTVTKAKEEGIINEEFYLWPDSLKDFLDKELHNHFEIKFYSLDPIKLADEDSRDELCSPIEIEPFEKLIKINIVDAQRGLFDANSSGSGERSLSKHISTYYDKHLNPSISPSYEDIEALSSIKDANNKFEININSSLKPAIMELEKLGYPGLSDPKISVKSDLNPIENLEHESAVQFYFGNDSFFCLPEKYNGLGYQNLLLIVLKLICFRDRWMRKGKYGLGDCSDDNVIQPLHLVLIEEPEAHLHAQVQQVFIKKAYEVLRNHDLLGNSKKFSTQMIVSTHSSHIAHEADFANLRYFRKKPASDEREIPYAEVKNLSEVFGKGNKTSKFVTRYLQSTHCELFFADALIIVEGAAERILLPQFIRQSYPKLDSRYITILEIGGAHAHRFKPLIEILGIHTLIITDIDSQNEYIDDKGDEKTGKVRPERNKNCTTNNDTLKKWIPQIEGLDKLIDLGEEEKKSKNNLVRVAFQCPIEISSFDNKEAIPYTFEDALVLTNAELFKGNKATGLLKKLILALSEQDLDEVCEKMFSSFKDGVKAKMALDVLYDFDIDYLNIPTYIGNGLKWLEYELYQNDCDYLDTEKISTEDKE
ncbi:AAA family ATPase [Methanoplanus sp. FWC-SCC4]|uniref:AAA family ATPase n=1 Tax=Methanochimaera problematica TaxID=2609417 RepID=A0AA97FBP7_9EURY|nr:AAA family ATPase [Methanoplanus sp. FWC-SCC4]WOF16132.1 AAA family ATPase [Methanoplanus sp. FWC-SCC4]